MAFFLMIIFIALYIFTKELWYAEIVKVNFGLVIGTLLGKKEDGSQSTRHPASQSTSPTA